MIILLGAKSLVYSLFALLNTHVCYVYKFSMLSVGVLRLSRYIHTHNHTHTHECTFIDLKDDPPYPKSIYQSVLGCALSNNGTFNSILHLVVIRQFVVRRPLVRVEFARRLHLARIPTTVEQSTASCSCSLRGCQALVAYDLHWLLGAAAVANGDLPTG